MVHATCGRIDLTLASERVALEPGGRYGGPIRWFFHSSWSKQRSFRKLSSLWGDYKSPKTINKAINKSISLSEQQAGKRQLGAKSYRYLSRQEFKFIWLQKTRRNWFGGLVLARTRRSSAAINKQEKKLLSLLHLFLLLCWFYYLGRWKLNKYWFAPMSPCHVSSYLMEAQFSPLLFIFVYLRLHGWVVTTQPSNTLNGIADDGRRKLREESSLSVFLSLCLSFSRLWTTWWQIRLETEQLSSNHHFLSKQKRRQSSTNSQLDSPNVSLHECLYVIALFQLATPCIERASDRRESFKISSRK